MYHINPKTGNPGVCKADPANPKSTGCKFEKGAEEHYATKEEARNSYERQQIKETYGPALRAQKAEGLAKGQEREAAELAAETRRQRAALRRFVELKWKPTLTADDTAELHYLERSFEQQLETLSPEERATFKATLLSISPRSRDPKYRGLHAAVSEAAAEQIRYQNLLARFTDEA